MIELIRSSFFDEWLSLLPDLRARAKIILRLRRAMLGNFGDCAPVGEGISEMRFHFGPGYRIYFLRRGMTVYLLLNGGDKSTQQRDIERAKMMAREIKDTRL